MFRPQCLFQDAQGSLQDRLRIGVPALVLVHHGDVVEALRRFCVVRPVDLFANFACALVERFGLRIEALHPVEFAQIGQA